SAHASLLMYYSLPYLMLAPTFTLFPYTTLFRSYIAIDPSIDFHELGDEQISEIRDIVFYHDEILTKLKSLGLNSNWDMLFIVIALHYIDLCKIGRAHV